LFSNPRPPQGHSEPVRRLVWESVAPSLHVCKYENAPGGERIAATVCALSRNDLRGTEVRAAEGGGPYAKCET
jgi:hypothetical protein